MQASCSVRLTKGGPLVPGVLTTDRAESSYGLPVVVVEGEVYGPAEVAAVYVSADCPIELADAAVVAGYHVLGQPRGKQTTGRPDAQADDVACIEAVRQRARAMQETGTLTTKRYLRVAGLCSQAMTAHVEGLARIDWEAEYLIPAVQILDSTADGTESADQEGRAGQ